MQGFDVTLAKMGDDAHAGRGRARCRGAIVFGNLAAPALVLAAAEGRADLVFLAGGVNQQFLVGAPGTTLDTLRDQPLGMSHPGDLTDFLGQLTIDRVLGGSGELRAVGGSQSPPAGSAERRGRCDAPLAAHCRAGEARRVSLAVRLRGDGP